MGNAARSILFDRQQAIEKSQAIEHANKIEDEITKNSSLILLKSLRHSTRRIKTNPEALQEKIRKQMTDECLVTPHDKMPNYKNSKCIRHRQTLH